jgi:transposase
MVRQRLMSTAVTFAALRSPARRRVAAEDHTAVLKVWSKRYRDLGRARTQVRRPAPRRARRPGSRRLQPGDHRRPGRQHAQAHQAAGPGRPGPARARRRLPRRPAPPGAQIRGTRSKLAAAVQAPGTTLTGIFGAGPVIAAAVLGTAGDPSRFGDRDRFAACNGTAPIEVSSGGRKIHRLSRRGNRRPGHPIHMAAVTQTRYQHSPGRACFDRKLAEGKTGNEALRCLKPQISDAIYARLQAGAARRATSAAEGPGGQPGNGSDSSAAGSHPGRRLFGKATPGPHPSLRPAAPARRAVPATPFKNSRRAP